MEKEAYDRLLAEQHAINSIMEKVSTEVKARIDAPKEIKDDAPIFCVYCGNPIQKSEGICRKCGAPMIKK